MPKKGKIVSKYKPILKESVQTPDDNNIIPDKNFRLSATAPLPADSKPPSRRGRGDRRPWRFEISKGIMWKK